MADGTSPTSLPQSSRGAIGGHDGGFGFITPHDDFKEILSRAFGKLLDTHVINNQKIRFEVAGQDFVMTREGFVMQEVSYYVEEGPIPNGITAFNGLVTEGLNQMAFAGARRA